LVQSQYTQYLEWDVVRAICDATECDESSTKILDPKLQREEWKWADECAARHDFAIFLP
jgi:hypothetical protein